MQTATGAECTFEPVADTDKKTNPPPVRIGKVWWE